MFDWTGYCDMCGKPSLVHTMSIFNTDLLCMECKRAERNDPGYAEAVEAERRAIQKGDYNYAGIRG